MQQSVQITKIEKRKDWVRWLWFLAGPECSAVTESRIQLLFVHAEAGSKANQRRAEKAANQRQ